MNAFFFAFLPVGRACKLAGDAPLVVGLEFFLTTIEALGRFAIAIVGARRRLRRDAAMDRRGMRRHRGNHDVNPAEEGQARDYGAK